LSLFDILIRGGWLMLPIALSSIVVIALGVNRWLILRREGAKLDLFVKNWTEAPPDAARFRSAALTGPDFASAAAMLFNHPGADKRSEIETLAQAKLEEFEKGLGTLATLAAINPLMGFLGTVTGMIRAFMQIQNLGGNVNANVLAGGIWEALITTAAGLVVGIVALVIHNYLAAQVRKAAGALTQVGEIALRQMGGGK